MLKYYYSLVNNHSPFYSKCNCIYQKRELQNQVLHIFAQHRESKIYCIIRVMYNNITQNNMHYIFGILLLHLFIKVLPYAWRIDM